MSDLVRTRVPGCAVREVRGADPHAFLLPEESAALGPAAPIRVEEFTIARTCARVALADLGHPVVPILRGSQREPLWPPDLVGSISHTRGYCAAAVARAAEVGSLGIDAELDGPLPAGVLHKVAFGVELEWLAAMPPGRNWDRIVFSAKESVFKAWFQLTHRWLGFEDAVISIDADAGTFQADLRGAELELARFCGRFAMSDQWILTAAWPDPRAGR